MAQKLSLSTLASLPDQVATPAYDRDALRAGIVHIGVGNFHRAHMAVYLDKLFSLGEGHDWALVGAGIKSFDADRRNILRDQDWLTTVVELAPGNLTARVTGSMIDFCEIDLAAIIARISDPAIRIVSMTITEGGYFVDATTGGFDSNAAAIQADIAAPTSPQTVFGVLIAGLAARRAAGAPPFTILSCDNLPENGHVTKQAVLGLANAMDAELAGWIEQNVAFPNSMVDCITPATSAREREMVSTQFGIEDGAPVACEPFRQWVMEDNFPQGRPALEKVGVEFVADVLPFETMKLRLLNAGHAALAYPAALLGHTYVHDAMADPLVRNWLISLMQSEVIPVLTPIPGVKFEDYLAMCVERFSNPLIGDTIARLCLDGSNRQPKFVIPTIADALAAGLPVDGLAMELALWCKYCAMTADVDFGFALEDERGAQLLAAAQIVETDPTQFLSIDDVFGDLGQNPVLQVAFAGAVATLAEQGVAETLRSFAAARLA